MSLRAYLIRVCRPSAVAGWGVAAGPTRRSGSVAVVAVQSVGEQADGAFRQPPAVVQCVVHDLPEGAAEQDVVGCYRAGSGSLYRAQQGFGVRALLSDLVVVVDRLPGCGEAPALEEEPLALLAGEELDERLRCPWLVGVARHRQILAAEHARPGQGCHIEVVGHGDAAGCGRACLLVAVDLEPTIVPGPVAHHGDVTRLECAGGGVRVVGLRVHRVTP